MEIQGRIHNGVVVLEGGLIPPEGTLVVVSLPTDSHVGTGRKKSRTILPLISSKRPGQLHLTNDMIAEMLNDQEVTR